MTSVKELCNFLNICGDNQENYNGSIVGYSGAVIQQEVYFVKREKNGTDSFCSQSCLKGIVPHD